MRQLMLLVTAGLLIAALASQASPLTAAGSITGTVWRDTNFNGTREASEPGAENVFLTISGSEQTARTDADGAYRFDGLGPGSYTVSISSGPLFGTAPRTEGGPISQSVALGVDATTTLDFGIAGAATVQRGSAYIDGIEADKPVVRAFVGDVECAAEPDHGLIFPPHSGTGAFYLYFYPPGLVEGCDLGETVRFTVDGRDANETTTYPPGNPTNSPVIPPNLPQPEYLQLTVGPKPAVYIAQRPWKEVDGKTFMADGEFSARIAGVDCGVRIASQGEVRSVLPAELRAGCGTEGAVVEFYFGDLKANETARWTPGFHDITLTLPDSAFAGPNGQSYLAALAATDDAPAPALQQPEPAPTPRPSTPASISPPDTGDGGLLPPMEASR